MNDPNALPDPNDPPVPEAPPEPPPAPQIDLEQAYDVIAQREGWDPRLTRYEIQEHKRRVQEFEREKREFEQRQAQAYRPPDTETSDPYMREILAIRREIHEERQAARAEREQNQLVNTISNEALAHYTSMARQSGLTKQQMEERSEEFFAMLQELYPEPKMIQQIGTERASRAAFRLLGGSSAPRQPQPYVNGRGRTASVVIPGSVTQSQAPVQDDGGPQRPGESLEEYVLRRRKFREDNPSSLNATLRENVRYSSE